MSQLIVIKGETREYAVALPLGWERWIQKLGRGLPCIVALHGGGQSPQAFMQTWPFHTIIDGIRSDADRFVVFYPFGSNVGGGDLPVARGWNTNWTSLNYQDVNDVTFIAAMVDTVISWMEDRLSAAGIVYSGPALDVDRRFLFGYSLGGMMAFQLGKSAGNDYAAIWAQSATYGGRRHFQTSLGSTVANVPFGGPVPKARSLFLHTGVLDENVVPNGTATDPPNRSIVSAGIYRDIGGMNNNWANNYARGDLPALASTQAYNTYNNTSVVTTLSNQPDRNGGNGSTRTQWRRAGGANNPIVEHYSDPTMNHTNFGSSPNRYFDQTDVWQWFKAHPRVS